MKKILILYVLLLGIPFLSLAQKNLSVDDVEVIKNFEATIHNVQIISVSPNIPTLDSSNYIHYSYEVDNYLLDYKYQPPLLRPLAMPQEELVSPYSSYAKFLIGGPLSTYGQLNIARIFDSGFELGVHGRHEYLNNTKKKPFHKYSDNDIGIEVSQTLSSNLRLSTQMQYSFDTYYLYGHSDSLSSIFKENTVKRRYKHFNFSAAIENPHTDKNEISYIAQINYSRFSNNQATVQNDFGFLLGGKKWFSGKHPLSLELGGEFTKQRDTLFHKLDNFFFNPTYTFHGEQFSAKIGTSIASSDDKFYFFPDIELNYLIPEKNIFIYVGTNGRLSKNTYKTNAQYNPYLVTRFDRIANTKETSFFLGGKGDIKRVGFHAYIKYSLLENMPVFNSIGIPSQDNPGLFNVSYIPKARMLEFTLNASYKVNKQIATSLIISKLFFNFPDRDTIEAFGIPQFILEPRATYTSLDKKMTAWAQLNIQSGTFYSSQPDFSNIKHLPTRFDLSFGVDYFLIENIGVSAQINNLFGNKYQRWVGYHSVGTQIQAGIAARF